MQGIRIFISSVQKEFAKERVLLCDYIRQDALLGKFFVPFLFEQMPAVDKSTERAYLAEVEGSNIYLGILGDTYGNEDTEGISPTEREYDLATAQHKHRLIFIKKQTQNGRHPKEHKFIAKVESELVRKSFVDFEELRSAVYASLINYLHEKEFLRILPFDATTNAKASLADIDETKIADFIHIAKQKRGLSLPVGSSVETVLTHLDLISDDGKLSNAAILLFGRNPQKFFVSSEIKCAQFYGTDITKPIPSYQVYRGDVFQLVSKVTDFIMSRINVSTSSRDKGAQVEVEYELPLAAVTEAIVNAVAHRDYTSNGSVQVMLFKDRLEIWNPGVLPLVLSVEKLRKPHSSIPTNPLLANPMYLTGYIERMGTGTGDIIRKCVDAGLRPPEFVQADDFKVIMWRTDQVTDQATDQVTDQAQAVDVRIVELVKFLDKPRKRSELQQLVGLKHNATFRSNYIDKAIAEGYIISSHPDTPTHPEQLYRLTDKGLTFYRSLLK